jgi:hypothetical protein
MGTIDVRAVRHVPGRLAFGCTDLTAAWPHGGTGLGVVHGLILTRYGTAYPATAEAFAGDPVEYLEPGEAWGIGGRIGTLDDDMLGKAFPSTPTGTISGHEYVTAPGSVHGGDWMSSRSFVCVFTPEGATHAASATAADVDAPFIVLYRCLPVMGDPLEITLNRKQDVSIRFAWMGIRDSSSRVMAFGRRRDLQVTGVFP